MTLTTDGGQQRDLSSPVVKACTKCGAEHTRKTAPWCNTCSAQAQREFVGRCKSEGLCAQCAGPNDGTRLYCSACRTRRSVWQAEKQQRGKQALVDAAGGKCVDCGLVTEWLAAYDFHHLDPSTKDINLSNYAMRSVKAALLETSKCVLLCAACHRIRHAKDRHHKGT